MTDYIYPVRFKRYRLKVRNGKKKIDYETIGYMNMSGIWVSSKTHNGIQGRVVSWEKMEVK